MTTSSSSSATSSSTTSATAPSSGSSTTDLVATKVNQSWSSGLERLLPTTANHISDSESSSHDPADPVVLFVGYSPWLLNFAAGACILYMIIGIPGNIITLLALFRTKKLSNATAVFIMNLAATDLLFCCFNLPLAASTFYHSDWRHGEQLCRLFPFLRYGLVAVSIFTILAITINRYVMIGHPRLYPKIYRPKYLAYMILSLWVCGFGALIPTYFELWGRFGLDREVGSCTILKDNRDASPKRTLFIAAFVAPCLAIVVCYARIFYIVRKTALKSRRRNGNEAKKSSSVGPFDKFSFEVKSEENSGPGNASCQITQNTYCGNDITFLTKEFDKTYSGLNFRKTSLPRSMESDLKVIDRSIGVPEVRVHNENGLCSPETPNDELQMGQLNPLTKKNVTHFSKSLDELTKVDRADHLELIDLEKVTLNGQLDGARSNTFLNLPNNSRCNSLSPGDYSISQPTSPRYEKHSVIRRSENNLRFTERLFLRRESRFYSSFRARRPEAGKLTAKDKKLLKMILVIFTSFVICYLPITITKTFLHTTEYKWWNITSYLLIYLTTCINPVIYVAMSSEYRSAYKRVLLCRADVKQQRAKKNANSVLLTNRR